MDSEEGRRALLLELMNQALEGPTTRMSVQDPRTLAAWELPPGTWGGLYLLYQAHCLANEDRPASKALFYEATKPWRQTLTFRRKSQHSTCQVCDRLRSEMRHSKSFIGHAKAADRLLGHLATTWRCRQIYWNARQQSRSRDADILCLITDGMDKSKPALPRWARGQPPKGGVFDRVTLNLSAILCHGHGCFVFLAEEPVSCGGSYTWECILQAIEAVWKKCCQSARPFPRAFLDLQLGILYVV